MVAFRVFGWLGQTLQTGGIMDSRYSAYPNFFLTVT
jgi:hypothetical protein